MTYHLYIQINDKDLESYYKEAIKQFNENKNNPYKDAGFDLFIPEQIHIPYYTNGKPAKIDHKVCCAVYKRENETTTHIPVSYYMYPRSSISKTPLRLANSVGIIDSGYRGNLIAKVDYIKNDDNRTYVIKPFTRLFQLCLGTLEPFDTIEIVENLSSTNRGSCGFGSTGD